MMVSRDGEVGWVGFRLSGGIAYGFYCNFMVVDGGAEGFVVSLLHRCIRYRQC